MQKHYVYSSLPEGHDPLYLLCVDTAEMVETLRAEISAFQEEAGVYTVVRSAQEHFPETNYPAYALLEVYSAAATRPAAVQELKTRISAEAVAVFGDSERDISMMEAADYSRAVAGADECLRESAGRVLSGGGETVVREIGRLYYRGRKHRNEPSAEKKS